MSIISGGGPGGRAGVRLSVQQARAAAERNKEIGGVHQYKQIAGEEIHRLIGDERLEHGEEAE
ncbi:hypothetical protein WBG83_15285 [Paenibacillus sp. y28]